ncbi:MAG: hypothetical protein IJ506_02525 [Clostridia bacterium]|nr:hypothetical protein [Clostridia bacterium]
MAKKVQKIDFSYDRLGRMADQYYNEGKYIAALRFAYKQYDEYGGDGDVYTRLADIYENMGLHSSAVNCWYKFLDDCEVEDLPDIYEGLAVNYLNMGNDSQSAYYYNQLINVDDTLPEETKYEIAETFSSKKKDRFRFVYPPEKADYSKELEMGSIVLKHGDPDQAIEILDKVAKGSKEYYRAKEMQAIAYLLSERAKTAENICLDVLEDRPDSVQAMSTLAAAYLEQDRLGESRALAEKLAAEKQENSEEIYKVATVCCENGLHEEAYRKFLELENEMPYDGRMLYFRAVAAAKSGRVKEAIADFDRLCTIYPDAFVAEYYLDLLREWKEGEPIPELSYFYRVPLEERERRRQVLAQIAKMPKEEAELFGDIAQNEGLFRWCFDEMDGSDHDLQYRALAIAVHASALRFIREALLDSEVSDVLKIETLRMLLERNEPASFGLVLCNIYRKIHLLKIDIGRKKRKKFIDGYARIASKFIAISDGYAKKIKNSAEKLYRAVEKNEQFDLLDNGDDIACAIYLLSGLRELGKDVDQISAVFEANAAKVRVLLASCASFEYTEKRDTREEKGYETH